MEQNLVLLSFQEGHKAKESAHWHWQDLTLCLWTSHTTLLQSCDLTLPSLFFCLKGMRISWRSRVRSGADTWVFSFIKIRSRSEMVPCACAGISHTGSAWLWWLDIPCWQVLGMVYPGEDTKPGDRKTSPISVSGSAFSHCSQVAPATFLADEETSLIFKHSQPCICCYLLNSFCFSQHYPVFQVTLVLCVITNSINTSSYIFSRFYC